MRNAHIGLLSLSRLLAAAWLILGVGSAVAADPPKTFAEGTYYEVRATEKSAEPEIELFFSFWCGHCFGMQEQFGTVAQHFLRTGKVRFLHLPVGILGGEMAVQSQYAFVVAGLHGVQRDFIKQMFDIIHVQNRIPEDHGEFVRMFAAFGVPEETFEQEYNSFLVKAQVARIDRLTDELKVEAVPEIVVNAKYAVNMSKLETVQDLIDVIEYLLTLP